MGKRGDIGTPVWNEKRNYWQLGVQVDGSRKWFYSSTPGRRGQRECEDKATAWLSMDQSLPSADPKLQDVYAAWLEEINNTGSKDTYRKNESIGRNHILPVIGKLHVSKLRTEQQLQEVLNKAWTKPASGKKLSKKTLSNIRSVLLSFIKYCRKCGYTTLYPENITLPQQAQVVGKRTLQPDELRILLTETETCRRYAWDSEPKHEWFIHGYRFQVLTGLRPGELLGLQWDDIIDSVVHIQRAINWHGVITPGKNMNARRTFVAPKLAMDELAAQHEQLSSAGIDTPYVFVDEKGNVPSQKRYERRLSRFCEFHGIEPICPYELRHTWYSINKALPTELVKQMGGHSQSMDTFGVYGHVVDGEMERMAQLIDEVVHEMLDP